MSEWRSRALRPARRAFASPPITASSDRTVDGLSGAGDNDRVPQLSKTASSTLRSTVTVGEWPARRRWPMHIDHC